MTESGREKVLEGALRPFAKMADDPDFINSPDTEALFSDWDGNMEAARPNQYSATVGDLRKAKAALASPSPQEPALRGGKVEEIAECFAWQNMDSAPRDGSSILIRHKYTHGNPIEVYRYSAGSDVYPYKTWEPEIGRTASIKGAIFPSEEDNYDWAPLDSTERIAAALRTHAGESAAQSERAGLEFAYTNYRGEKSTRRVIVEGMRYGSSQWHLEEQWLLVAHDLDKGQRREFAIKDMRPLSAVRKAGK